MKEIKRYAKYTCGKNGVAKDGHTMFIKDIVKDLNRKSYLEKRYTDHKEVVEAMQKRIDKLEAEREQIKSAIDPGYDDIRYSMILLNEILKEV